MIVYEGENGPVRDLWKVYGGYFIGVSLIAFCVQTGVEALFNKPARRDYIPSVHAEGVKETVKPTVTPTPTLTVTEEQRQKARVIEDYIKKIFGPDYPVARAISHHECYYTFDMNYPGCVLHTEAEHSIGLFQINLYNSLQKVHFDRVPGATVDEKVEWLKDPYNNTLYAYWVFKTSGWYPWTAYTNGSYKQSLQ